MTRQRRGKYHAQKTMIGGVLYDSKLEASVALVLQSLHVPVKRQVPIVLRPAVRAVRATKTRAAVPGLRAVTYIADFVAYPPCDVVRPGYTALCIEPKGVLTPVASLKMRLMAEYHPEIEVWVVRSPEEAHARITQRRAEQQKGKGAA